MLLNNRISRFSIMNCSSSIMTSRLSTFVCSSSSCIMEHPRLMVCAFVWLSSCLVSSHLNWVFSSISFRLYEDVQLSTLKSKPYTLFIIQISIVVWIRFHVWVEFRPWSQLNLDAADRLYPAINWMTPATNFHLGFKCHVWARNWTPDLVGLNKEPHAWSL